MRKDSGRRFMRKATLLTLAVALVGVGVAGSGVATGSSETAARGSGGTPTIHATFSRQRGIRFVGPDRIKAGTDLRIVNNTSPRVVGPHTFSLVTRGVLPKTRGARRSCFAPNHICREIAAWHGSNGNSPPTENPAKAGQDGWDRLGNLNRDGDSWFSGRRGSSLTQQVSIDPTDTPQRLYYLCAVHSFMQGSINVVP